jgi:DNA-binding response OmpR family regulator
VHVLLAADAAWLVDEIVAALGGPTTSFTVCSEGREVSRVLADRTDRGEPVDLGIFDLQIGSMGGMAVTMNIRLDASSGTTPDIPVLMLLDRTADVHLARRSGADGWLVKPLDPLRLRKAVRTVLAGGSYQENLDGAVVIDAAPTLVAVDADDDAATPTEADPEAAGQEPVTAG